LTQRKKESIIIYMNLLLYVSVLLVMAHLTPPVGVVQLREPGFETQVECHTWIEENKEEIIVNVLISFGPLSKIKGVACMTESDARDFNTRWGHGAPEKDGDNFLKQFDGGET